MKINLSAIRKVLGIITDILLLGRNKGLWSKGPSISDPNKYNTPRK